MNTTQTGRPASGAADRTRTAGSAFWIMTRRVTVMAGTVDVLLLLAFLAFDEPLVGWLNLLSIAIYVVAYRALKQRRNRLGLALIWVEVVTHAVVGTVWLGWHIGFHYYLLMFIPAIAVAAGGWQQAFLLGGVLTLYLSLDHWSVEHGPMHPMDPVGQELVYAINVVVVFVFAAYAARYYYQLVAESERRLRQLASTDPLTGLANRRHMLLQAEDVLVQARRIGVPTSVVLIDIDHFKQVNDTCGHEGGDAVLVHVAGLLAANCREADLLARWGGEEFLLVLAASDAEAGHMRAELVRRLVAESPVTVGEVRLPVTLSVGVTVAQPHEGLDEAIARADRALYASKSAGRDRVSLLG
ncbi:GGDEF domain-containing protein [Ottowia sp.]|uniref:GGDEF domain-containing protein n=1 Tax=Ottowia sp. TaxID=1898956 RepID=UPI00263628F7|nr:GGDEF domain-containing protein [Ottowia sp.]